MKSKQTSQRQVLCADLYLHLCWIRLCLILPCGTVQRVKIEHSDWIGPMKKRTVSGVEFIKSFKNRMYLKRALRRHWLTHFCSSNERSEAASNGIACTFSSVLFVNMSVIWGSNSRHFSSLGSSNVNAAFFFAASASKIHLSRQRAELEYLPSDS